MSVNREGLGQVVVHKRLVNERSKVEGHWMKGQRTPSLTQ